MGEMFSSVSPAHTGFHPPPCTLMQQHQSVHVTRTEWQPPPHTHPFGFHLAPQCSTAMPEHPCHQNGNQCPVDHDPAHSFGLISHTKTQQPPQMPTPHSNMTPAHLFSSTSYPNAQQPPQTPTAHSNETLAH